MSVSYNDGLAQARVFLREDAQRLKANDWILIAEQARQVFSKDKPRSLIADITGNNTHNYTLSGVVASWVNRFSSIKTVEYPSGKEPPSYAENSDWMIYRSATDTEILKFLESTPSPSQTIRITYTSRHSFDVTTTTIDDDDKMLIALLLAGYAAQALVADFLKPNRSNLPNDSVDFDQKAKSMADLAKELLSMYGKLLSGKSPDVPAYFTLNKDFDMLDTFGNKYITHPDTGR